MPRFSTFSLDRLSTCDDRIKKVMHEVIKEYDCRILVGHRREEQQNEMFRQGLSKLEWPYSKHNVNPSLAVDVAPYPIDWGNMKRFYHFGGYVQGVARKLDVVIRWGGDWDSDFDLDDQTFMDLVHFELKG